MNREQRIRTHLSEGLSPLHLEVVDESHLHQVPPGAESHFKVGIVSAAFAGSGLIGRHRTVNHLLRDEFQTGLHALALHTWTPEEWFDRAGAVPESPPCLGGSKGT
jgi:BolA protein